MHSLRSRCWSRTCQRTLAKQQVLRNVLHCRSVPQRLFRHQGEAEYNSSTSSEEKVHAHKDHHQFGRHVGGLRPWRRSTEEIERKELKQRMEVERSGAVRRALVDYVDYAQGKLLDIEKRSEEKVARTVPARELHGTEDMGASSIKKRCEGVSQLAVD